MNATTARPDWPGAPAGGGEEDSGEEGPEKFPLDYRVIATTLHVVIFVLGVAGNIVLIAVVGRSRLLHTPTYAYLVSLAVADLLVICTAIPEAVVFHHLGKRWLLGPAGCAIFIFLNFLGINAGSLSILALTMERYVAICRPYLARKFCTMERTSRSIAGMWCFAILYCCPWLGLTEVKREPFPPFAEQCEFRLPPATYMIVFAADLLLFYLVPLFVALIVYAKIGAILCRSLSLLRREDAGSGGAGGGAFPRASSTPCSLHTTPKKGTTLSTLRGGGFSTTAGTPHAPLLETVERASYGHGEYLEGRGKVTGDPRETEKMQNLAVINSRTQILRILIVIVVLFALSWLPFRGLLVYNSFVKEPWLDIWYLLFAKTLIYVNSAINPFVYNAMSKRFRLAVLRMLCGRLISKSNEKSRTHRRPGGPPAPPLRRAANPAAAGQGTGARPFVPRRFFNANILFSDVPTPTSTSGGCRKSSAPGERRRGRGGGLPSSPSVREMDRPVAATRSDVLGPSRPGQTPGYIARIREVHSTVAPRSQVDKIEDDPLLVIYKSFYDYTTNNYHSSPN
ncbi:thyrotropin-releasing hormone receptor-like [Paramacrobiotus metropolitanus]|uniref:thyrotropin-releasing hormone receptor-like n=1 Tax=Paramacrobiotus metropolitanus TaxID=2943436 RepID=UPI002445F89F|nr:thyrotropin-releasing hormone receptor-like [Paramacrobiotus metropolitanus]